MLSAILRLIFIRGGFLLGYPIPRKKSLSTKNSHPRKSRKIPNPRDKNPLSPGKIPDIKEFSRHKNSGAEKSAFLGLKITYRNYFSNQTNKIGIKILTFLLLVRIFRHLNFQTRVENALAATIEPLHINRECQGLRQQRVATDDCDDPVDRDLAKEIGVIQSSADLLKAEGFEV